MNLLIKNGRIVDPVNHVDQVADLLIEDGKVRQIGQEIPVTPDAEAIDAAGQWVVPGFIDVHTHLREPGF